MWGEVIWHNLARNNRGARGKHQGEVEEADKGDSGDRREVKEESEGGRVRCNRQYRDSEL